MSGHDLIEDFSLNFPIDLLILDIEMPYLDGYETAKYFRKVYPKAILVFCTGKHMPTVQSFEAEAYRFLLKTINPQETCNELVPVFKKMISTTPGTKIGIYFENDTIQFIDPDRILYATRKKHGCDVVLYDAYYRRTIKAKSKMHIDELYDLLDKYSFAYPRNSHLINLKYVLRIADNNTVKLIDGTEITIARARVHTFTETVTRYYSDMPLRRNQGKRVDQ